MKDKIAFAIGAWFGCGYMPAARGTWGALCALLLAWPLARFGPITRLVYVGRPHRPGCTEQGTRSLC